MEETRAGQIDKEYMIQHFGTDPSFLIEDICEDFKDCLTSSITGIKDVVKKKQAGKFEESELDRKLGLLEEDYKAYFEKKCLTLDGALKQNIFKVPQNVLLKEDLVWENLPNSVAKDKKTNLSINMEKQRNEYKTALYKKTYLRNYIDKLKLAAVYQEELIQREATLKEKYGLQDSVETLKFLEREWQSGNQQLTELRNIKEQVAISVGEKKRPLPSSRDVNNKDGNLFTTEKRLKLEERLKENKNQLEDANAFN